MTVASRTWVRLRRSRALASHRQRLALPAKLRPRTEQRCRSVFTLDGRELFPATAHRRTLGGTLAPSIGSSSCDRRNKNHATRDRSYVGPRGLTSGGFLNPKRRCQEMNLRPGDQKVAHRCRCCAWRCPRVR